jgi:hypothetical protein
MKRSRNSVGNLASVSIRKGHVQKHATDATRYEKTHIPTLSLEALRALARIVKTIKGKLTRQADRPLDTQVGISPHAGSPATNCQDCSQNNEGTNQEKQ